MHLSSGELVFPGHSRELYDALGMPFQSHGRAALRQLKKLAECRTEGHPARCLLEKCWG
jgi:hypothetical protein